MLLRDALSHMVLFVQRLFDFSLEGKSRGGTLVARTYIKDSTYSSNMQSVYKKKSRFARTGAARSR